MRTLEVHPFPSLAKFYRFSPKVQEVVQCFVDDRAFTPESALSPVGIGKRVGMTSANVVRLMRSRPGFVEICLSTGTGTKMWFFERSVYDYAMSEEHQRIHGSVGNYPMDFRPWLQKPLIKSVVEDIEVPEPEPESDEPPVEFSDGTAFEPLVEKVQTVGTVRPTYHILIDKPHEAIRPVLGARSGTIEVKTSRVITKNADEVTSAFKALASAMSTSASLEEAVKNWGMLTQFSASMYDHMRKKFEEKRDAQAEG